MALFAGIEDQNNPAVVILWLGMIFGPCVVFLLVLLLLVPLGTLVALLIRRRQLDSQKTN